MDEEKVFNSPAEELEYLNTAIQNVYAGGQSYKIGTRQMERANLSTLLARKKQLEAEVNSNSESSSLFPDTYVAVFEGR